MDVSRINSSEHRRAIKEAAGDIRNMDQTGTALANWLEGRIGTGVAVSNVRVPTGAGIANETLLFKAEYDDGAGRKTRGLVARIKPVTVQLFPDPDFEGLFRLLSTLREHDLVQVAEPLWLEDDPTIVGAPFFVMGMVEGRTPVTQPPYTRSGWLADGTPEQRHTAWRGAIEGLASIHRVPYELVSFLSWPQYGKTGEDQQLGYWNYYSDWTGIEMPKSLKELDKWVHANRPNDPGFNLSWGDARIGNMMFGDDFRIAAVLDWDQMAIADPRHDLAWWLFFDRFNAEGQGIPRPEGFGSREETIALWEELSGHKAENLGWYEAYMTYKIGLITMKTLISGKRDYADAEALVDSFAKQGMEAAGA